MRTSNYEENNEEVKGHLQSESRDQQENLQLQQLNSTSSSELSVKNNKDLSVYDYPIEVSQNKTGSVDIIGEDSPLLPHLLNPDSSKNRLLRTRSNKRVETITIDSDVEIIEKNPLRETKKRSSREKKVSTTSKKLKLANPGKRPLYTAPKTPVDVTKLAKKGGYKFFSNKENKGKRKNCEVTVADKNQDFEDLLNKPFGYKQTTNPSQTSTNKKLKKANDEHTTNTKEDMSMYDYRFADPQLPSTASYYTTTTTKAASSATEEQQNTTNATAQNLLDSNKTIATLCNIGNSCYLNSVVYTLRFAPLFLHKLHHLIEDMATIYIKLNPTKHKSSSLGRNVSLWQGHSGRSWSSKDLASLGSITGNDSVPKNNRLIVTEKLHELYQNLHKNESSLNTEPFHAGTFLQAIQEVCSIFEGNQQQDAHECLMCILDSIRETCDTLATAIIDSPEQLLAEYGLGSLIEESRNTDEQQQQQSLQQLQQQVSQQQSSGSSKGFGKFLSRKSKRKKSDDDNTVQVVANTSPVNPEKPPESPSKERASGDGQQSDIINNHHEEGGDGSSTATSPTSTIDTKLTMKNALLKALAGEHDVNDKPKLKENVCKMLGLNFFCEDFEGVTVSSIKCLTCEQVKTLKEKMIDISVPITGHENPDSMSNPQSFFQNSCITKEYFRGENKYRCENCFGYTEAIRSITYEILPRLLVIHLKRFSGGMEKINSYIPTPFTLKCFCNSCLNLPDEEKLHIYKLYSVITHVGATMSVGHYVAYTCALDIQNEYRVCTNDRSKIATLFQNNNTTNGTNSTSTSDTNASSQTTGSNSSLAPSNGDKSSGPKMIKRFLFGNKKANSSNDLKSNSFKSNMNGLVNKVVANGMEKLNIGINNTTGRSSNGTSSTICQGQKCCGIKENKLVSNNNGTFISYVNGSNGGSHMNGTMNGSHHEMDTLAPPSSSSSTTKPSSSDLSIASSSNSNLGVEDGGDATVSSTTTTPTTGGTTGTSSSVKVNTQVNNITQDHWYMCDDDKIKVMQQQQFEEHLSPTRKNMITPYLLFYARFDAHPL